MTHMYMLVVREPSEERVQYGPWQASMTEQLNHVACMILRRVFEDPAAAVVFEIRDIAGRTIRFTSPQVHHLQLITEYARELGLEVVLGPVQRPDARTEQLEAWASHLSWRSLEDQEGRDDLPESVMQLIQARLGKKELDLTRELRGWTPEQVRNRLLNTKLAVSERRILEQALSAGAEGRTAR